MAEEFTLDSVLKSALPVEDKTEETKPLPQTGGIDYSLPTAGQPESAFTVTAPGEGTGSIVNVPPKSGTLDEILQLSETVDPGLEEYIGTGITTGFQGLKTGFVTGTPTFMGGVYGAKLGALGGPFAPVTTPLFSVLGMVAGYTVGNEYSQYLDQFFPLPRDALKPYAKGVEATTQAIATIPLSYGIPVYSGNVVSKFISDIGASARRRPLVFAATEAGAAGTGGVGATIAESFYPGDTAKGMLYEVTYGFLSPTRLFSQTATKIVDHLTARVGSGALSGPQIKAANTLVDLLGRYGEDPKEVIRALSAATPYKVTPTAGQKTGSPTLMALERSLANDHETYGEEIKQMGIDSLEAYRVLLAQLRNLGDTESLKLAAQMQSEWYDNMLAQKIAVAHAEAAKKIRKISETYPNTQARTYFGTIIQDEVGESLKQARKVETELWQTAFKGAYKEVEGLPMDSGLREMSRDAFDQVKAPKGTELPQNSTSEMFKIFPEPIIGDKRFALIKGPDGTQRAVYADLRHTRTDFKEVVKEGKKYYEISYDQAKIPKAYRNYLNMPSGPEKAKAYEALEKANVHDTWWHKVPLVKKEVKFEKDMVPITLEPTSLRDYAVDVVANMTAAGRETKMPGYLKSMLKNIGIDEDVINTYKQGQRTQSAIRDGEVPEEYRPSVDLPPIEVSELIKYRGELLAEASTARAAGDSNTARIYGDLAQKIMDDLTSDRAKDLGLNTADYNTAREFSRSLNDVYTRTFGGKMLATDARGALRISPEELIQTVFSSGTDLTALRISQIQDTADFLLQQQRKFAAENPNSDVARNLTKLLPELKQRFNTITEAQTAAVRMAAADAIDYIPNPRTGEMDARLNVKKLTDWAEKNNELVEKMGLAGDLDNATRAENLYKLTLKNGSQIVKDLKKRYALDKLIIADNTSAVVSAALKGKNPENALRRLVLLAKRSGPDAVDGLRATVMDYAFTQASKRGGGFSPTVFQEAMFQPFAPGRPSLYTMMRRQGIMEKSHGKNMQELLVPMIRVERELSSGMTIDNVIKNYGMLGQFATRVVGARIAADLNALTGGRGTIQVPAFGAALAQQLFDKMPALTVRKVLEEATKDPAFMAQILSKKGIGNWQQLNQSRQMHAYLFSQGYTDASFDEEELPTVPETPTTGASASKLLRQLPSAPATRGLPFMSQAQAAPPAQGPGPAAPAPPGSSRRMLQSLFPFDTTLQLPQ